MPLGKEVKVMQCWRCKAYGHRTGDKECPLSKTGNITLDVERQVRALIESCILLSVTPTNPGKRRPYVDRSSSKKRSTE